MFLFAMVMEREPTKWADLPLALVVWLQNGGAVAAMAIAIVLLARALQKNPNEWVVWNIPKNLAWLGTLLYYCIVAGAVGYAVLLLIWAGALFNVPRMAGLLPRSSLSDPSVGDWLFTISGILAVTVAVAPVLIDFAVRIRWGRIWAIALLSWKEAVRGRVIWVFGSMALVFLFADWFVPYKAENQLRSYVQVIYWSMTPLFLITAGLLGAFSIPTDVLNNSIHTIVTKPVEKFEIVLGRFFGYGLLLTIGLFAVAALSLVYLVRGINEDAARESYRARVVQYGKLQFAGTKDAMKGDSVGREFTYRSYITGPTPRQAASARQYAVWDYSSIPSDLGEREAPALFEFAFDIFRLSKGKEGEGVFCTFTFADGAISANGLQEHIDKMKELRTELEEKAGAKRRAAEERTSDAKQRRTIEQEYLDDMEKIEAQMIEKFHVYQKREAVTDQHTQEIVVPARVFKTLFQPPTDSKAPKMRVFVSVDKADEAQMVGMAQYDLYLVSSEMPFWQNFLKGIVGMWCTHMIVLGVALACSTYLSSVISLLNTMFLFIAGTFSEYLKEIAERRVDGGGPTESAWRVFTHQPIAVRLEDTPTHSVMKSLDTVFSWWVGRIMNLLPDVNRHDLHLYVANGFDIGWIDILFLDNLLPVAAYLLPWAVLAYYLMKYREIANPQ